MNLVTRGAMYLRKEVRCVVFNTLSHVSTNFPHHSLRRPEFHPKYYIDLEGCMKK